MSSNKVISLYIHTLGCPKNEWDSDLLLSSLSEAGFETAPENAAEVIVVNTCAFIEEARKESIDEILRLAEYKEAGTCRLLVVTGCLAERYRDALSALLPEVDLFVPLTGGKQLTAAISEELEMEDGGETRKAARRLRCSTERSGMAYVKISEGCDRACTFCAIPSIRGPLVSRTVEDVTGEAAWLLGMGTKELVLVAQDTTAYGTDLYGQASLPALLRELCALDGEFRIRLLYLQPEGLDDELLDAMRHPRVCRYLDIPLQHVSRNVLRTMGRLGSPEHFGSLLEHVHASLPGVTLRTTMLVGFPGERREDFNEVVHFVGDQRFDWLGVFGYSREEGTRAWGLGPGPRRSTVEARCARLMQVQNEIMLDRAEQQVGSTVQVLVERPSDTLPGCMEGRSERHAPDIDGLVYVRGQLETGSFYQVKITGTEGIDEVGRVAG